MKRRREIFSIQEFTNNIFERKVTSMSETKRTSAGNVATVATEGYDYSVASRMSGRAGSSSPLGGKGNAFEIMYGDQKNMANILKPEMSTRLTHSSTATQADLVTTKGGRIVERIQCKDTPSIKGAADTIKRVQSGQYRTTQLVGTSESAAAYNTKAASKGVTKVMKDSGISTRDTSRISNKFNGVSSTTGIANAAKTSAKFGGVVGGGVAAIESIANGADFSTATGNVASGALKGSLSGAAGTATSEATMIALAAAPIPLVAKVAIGIGTGLVAGTVAGDVVSDVCDGVGEAVSDVIDGIGDFFGGLFSLW